jgi:polyisoprenoid-binding protein YceI
MKSLPAVLTLAMILGSGSLVAQGTWKNDKAHSQAKFSVTHMLISEVAGAFKDFDVTVVQPGKEDFSGSTVQAVIKTASVSTDNDRRDNHLRSDDFFNAEKYPEIKFISTSFEKTGTDTYKITGNLTIRDTTKQVVLDAKMLGAVDAWGGKHVGFKATTTINRFDYNVRWDKTLDAGGLIVSKNVDITLFLELFIPPKDAPKPKG